MTDSAQRPRRDDRAPNSAHRLDDQGIYARADSGQGEMHPEEVRLSGRGYWAKKEVGQAVGQLALPPLKEPISLLKPTPRPAPPKVEEFATPAESEQVANLKGGDP
jgi:hypothetical protein